MYGLFCQPHELPSFLRGPGWGRANSRASQTFPGGARMAAVSSPERCSQAPFGPQGQSGYQPSWALGDSSALLDPPCSCPALEQPLPSLLSSSSYQRMVLGPVGSWVWGEGPGLTWSVGRESDWPSPGQAAALCVCGGKEVGLPQ